MSGAASSARACNADFTAALIRRDIDAALSLLRDDVIFFYSNGSTVVGKDAFAEQMTASWKVVSDYEYSTLNPLWIAESESAATLVYGFAWSGLARGDKVSGSGRATRVFSRDASGWLIAHEHLSTGAWQP